METMIEFDDAISEIPRLVPQGFQISRATVENLGDRFPGKDWRLADKRKPFA